MDILGSNDQTDNITWWENTALPVQLSSFEADSIICAGEEVTFTVQDGFTNYEFFVNNSSEQDGMDNAYTPPSLDDGDEVKVTVTNSFDCSVTSDSIPTTVEEQPTAFAGSDQDVCNPPITLAADLPNVGTGLWTIVSGDGNGEIDDVNSNTSLFSGTLGETYTLQWEVTNGNCTDADEVDITSDGLKPDAQCKNDTLQLDANGNGLLLASDVDNGSSDDCGIQSRVLDKSIFSCNDQGDHVVTLTVTDPNGNSSACTGTITVEDDTNPCFTCPSLNGSLVASPNPVCANSTFALSVANLSGMASADNGEQDFGIRFVWFATATTTPYTGGTDIATVPYGSLTSGSTEAVHNGVPLPVGSYEIYAVLSPTPDDATCRPYLETSVTFDATQPTALCKDHTVQLDASGNGLLLATDLDNGSSDDCGVQSRVLDQGIFSCGDNGSHVVTLTVTDTNNNFSSCTSTVTVDDSVFPCCASTHIIYVDENTPDDDDGSDWDNAFATLERALDLAGRCAIATEIWVADGAYYPTSGTDRTVSFSSLNGVAVYGGFAGSETSLAERDIANNACVLSGDIGTPGNSSDNSYHVVYNKGGGINATAILDGFTISDGNANYLGDYAKGGGMYIESASPTVRNCTFSGNNAGERGGGLYCENTNMAVGSCTFSGNSAKTGGAAANYTNASASYNACAFEGNTATSLGSAIANNSSDISITGCSFIGNTTPGDGCISNIASSPDVFNCIFTANEADEGAGVFNIAGSGPTITNCTFYANVPGATGGTIRNNTGTSPVITNCILWGNGSEIVESLPGATVTYSIVDGGHPGTGNLNVDPMFMDSTDLRPSPCSDAVDAGNNTANSLPTDIAGKTRTVNSLGILTIDMGAYEVQGHLLGPCTWTGNGDNLLWSDEDNWSDGFVPQLCRDVLIPTGFSVIIPGGYVGLGKTLEVELGGELETDAGGEMDINNQ